MTTRLLANDLVKSGSSLHEILSDGSRLKEQISTNTTKNADFDEVERFLKDGMISMHEKISQLEKEFVKLQTEHKTAQYALEKRKGELQRSEERLSTFLNVRPAYMDEYEELEKELKTLFPVYVERFRNLQWLEAQLEGFHVAQQQKHEEVQARMKALQRQFQEEEMKFLHGVDMGQLCIDNEHLSDMGDYGQPMIDAVNCLPTSSMQVLGSKKLDTEATSSATPSIEPEAFDEPEVDDNLSDSFF